MAVEWTKLWSPSDDGTVIRGIDLRNIQDDINTTGLADADKIQGFPVDVPTSSDDGKSLVFDNGNSKFTYTTPTGIPVGLMAPYGGATAPAGWDLCDGRELNRTTFADLFAILGTTFGTGNGSTTFNIPDIRGRQPLGLDNLGGSSANRVTDAAADTLGSSDGSESSTAASHVLTTAEIPAHTHTQDDFQGGATTGNGGNSNINLLGKVTGSTGGGGGHTHSIDT